MSNSKMKAAVINGPGLVDVIEKDIPSLGSGEVLVKVRYCGICGSDIHAYHTGFFPPVMIFGHEYVGEVFKSGEGVNIWNEGDPVCGNNLIGCGRCRFCVSGRENICPDMQRIGIFQSGAMAEYVVVPSDSLHPYPAANNFSHGIMAEPLSVALHGIDISGIKWGDERPVVIVGAGTIGLCVLSALKNMGKSNVAVIEKDAFRAAVAGKMGAGMVLDPSSKDTSRIVGDLLEGGGEGTIFECAGNPAAISSALDMICQGGTIVIMSICEKPVDLNFLRLVTGEIKILTSCAKTNVNFSNAVKLLLENHVDFSPAVTIVKGLQIVPETLAAMASGQDQAIKVIIEIP